MSLESHKPVDEKLTTEITTQDTNDSEKKLEKADNIDTQEKVAREISRLYEAFKAKAIELTDEYWKSRFEGKEGETWREIGSSYLARKIPIFDKVTKRNGKILLNGYYDFHIGGEQGYKADYILEETAEGIYLKKPGVGYGADTAFVISPDGKLKQVGYHVEPPYSGPQGVFPGRAYLHKTKRGDVTELKEIKDIAKALQTFE